MVVFCKDACTDAPMVHTLFGGSPGGASGKPTIGGLLSGLVFPHPIARQDDQALPARYPQSAQNSSPASSGVRPYRPRTLCGADGATTHHEAGVFEFFTRRVFGSTGRVYATDGVESPGTPGIVAECRSRPARREIPAALFSVCSPGRRGQCESGGFLWWRPVQGGPETLAGRLLRLAAAREPGMSRAALFVKIQKGV